MERGEFRQWALIHIMSALMSNTEFTKQVLTPKQVAKSVIELADALLEANTVNEESQ